MLFSCILKRRQVSTEEGEKKAKEFNVIHIESSAKAGYNVKALFKKIAQALPGMDNAAEPNKSTMIDVKLNPSKAAESSSCAC